MKVKIIPSDEFNRQFKRLAKKYKSLGKDYLDFRKGFCKISYG
jgi:mRNA-degrading endonuclease RelE of RelBE toxin-antitoxin system